MKTLKEQKWMLIVYAVIFIAIGLLEFILSIVKLSSAIHVVSYAVASGLLVIGLLHIIGSLISDTKAFFKAALVIGSIAIAMGIVLFINPGLISSFLIQLVAILILALSVVLLTKGVLAIIYKYKVSWIILYFVTASIGIVFGVLCLVYVRTFTQVIYAATGLAILAIGIFVLVIGIKALSKKKEEPVEA